MRNIKLLVEYDGTNYVGWQKQQNGKSIQEEIEIALVNILQESINLIGAGRTDAGVHARGQVANFRTQTSLEAHEIKGALNALLPDDIVIKNVEEVPLDFHARYSAKERHYSYLIITTPTALLRNYSWFVRYQIDFNLLISGAQVLYGVHDFKSFCKANSDVDNYNCNIKLAEWKKDDNLLKFSIAADRFLHGMVRAIVGTMIDLGRGYISFDEYVEIFNKKDRSYAGVSAPAKGLTLERIVY